MFGKGSIILVLGFGIVAGIMSARMSGLQTQAIDNMSYYHDITVSNALATAGANAALSKLYQNTTLRGLLASQTFDDDIYGGGTFTARIDSLPTTKLRLRSVSRYRGYGDTVEVFFNTRKLNSFSMFAWMTNIEGSIWWITGDTVWGRVHSNDILRVSGRPVYYDKVTTAKKFSPNPGTGSNNAIFKKGYETGVARVEFPNDLSELINASSAGGRNYSTNIWVDLSAGTPANGDGKAYVRLSSGGAVVDSISINDGLFNGALWSTQRVHVRGQLDGQLTIGAGDDIVVRDDITYESNPLVNSASDDMLGLVAEDDVIIENNAANNDKCTIHASIFTRTGSYTAEDYASRPVAGALTVVGGIIQNARGPVGTFSGSTLVSGFSKRYYYDPRLSDPQVRPPYFPGFFTKTLTVADWWESVRIPEEF